MPCPLQTIAGENSCYLNATLQMMLACVHDIDGLFVADTPLVEATLSLWNRYRSREASGAASPVETEAFRQVVSASFPALRSGIMNDAGEFYEMLTEALLKGSKRPRGDVLERLIHCVVSEQFECQMPKCLASSDDLRRERPQSVLRVRVSELFSAETERGEAPFGELLQAASSSDMVTRQPCPLCGESTVLRQTAMDLPTQMLVLQLTWAGTPRRESSRALFARVIEDALFQRELRAVVLFHASHYVTAVRQAHTSLWLWCDGEAPPVLVGDWATLTWFACCRGFAPMLLAFAGAAAASTPRPSEEALLPLKGAAIESVLTVSQIATQRPLSEVRDSLVQHCGDTGRAVHALLGLVDLTPPAPRPTACLLPRPMPNGSPKRSDLPVSSLLTSPLQRLPPRLLAALPTSQVLAAYNFFIFDERKGIDQLSSMVRQFGGTVLTQGSRTLVPHAVWILLSKQFARNIFSTSRPGRQGVLFAQLASSVPRCHILDSDSFLEFESHCQIRKVKQADPIDIESILRTVSPPPKY